MLFYCLRTALISAAKIWVNIKVMNKTNQSIFKKTINSKVKSTQLIRDIMTQINQLLIVCIINTCLIILVSLKIIMTRAKLIFTPNYLVYF